MAPITFYFDFISPYAHIGWAMVKEVARRHGRDIEARPVLFAALLGAHGTKGPAEVPAKRIYTFKDAFRKAHRAGLPRLVPPPSHPFNPLAALRAASVPSLGTTDLARLTDALFAAAWSTGEGVETKERVAAVATSIGLDGDALVTASETPEVKAILRARTEEALAQGVFGVPTVMADGELFWGTDGVELASDRLAGKDPLPADFAWADRPASAVRRGL